MKGKILLIEDDESVGQVVKDFMEVKGYNVVWKTNGREALEEALENKYDLILLDVNLPEVNGFEICRRIRERPLGEIVPIVIITVLRQLPDRLRGLSYGADEYITKPFDLEDVLKKIKTVIEKKRKNLEINPTTNLPGYFPLKEECEKLKGKDFFLGYFYSDNFNNYTKLYRYEKAVEFIKRIAAYYKKRFKFLFHLENMQFYFISEENIYEKSKEMGLEVLSISEKFYDEIDFERGYSVIPKPGKEGIIDNIRFYTSVLSLKDKENFEFEEIMNYLLCLYRFVKEEDSCFIFEDGRKVFFDMEKRKILFFSNSKFFRTYFKKTLTEDDWKVEIQDKMELKEKDRENFVFLVDSDIDFAKEIKEKLNNKKVLLFRYGTHNPLVEITEKGNLERSPYYLGLKTASFIKKI